MWWGAAAAQWLMQSHRLGGAVSLPGAQVLARMGRWSLSYYMLHQPVLIGLALGLSKLLA
jgi:peptidoglycan/LPS O-acetylase OafA/YrhL